MERKLASIKKIDSIKPIDGADMIELAIFGGWQSVIAKKDGFKPGDLVIYCEIDSFLPIKPEFEFLRKSSYKKMGDLEGFRLKSTKLRGAISQGLVLPISVLGDIDFEIGVGYDVTELLGIIKYEPPIPAELAGKVKGLFPSFIPKTDEERIQNLSEEYVGWLASDKKFYVTEKLDGSSATFYYKDGVFGVCSRNLELLETEGNTFWQTSRHMGIEDKLSSLGYNASIQGELIGEGVQGNPYKIKGHIVVPFNVFNIDTQKFLPLSDFLETMDKLGLTPVPILDYDFKLLPEITDMLNYAEQKSQLNPDFDREGVVIRSHDRTISFKVISNKFLLNGGN
jgi:RNA ligase (TIGR02306 family)